MCSFTAAHHQPRALTVSQCALFSSPQRSSPQKLFIPTIHWTIGLLLRDPDLLPSNLSGPLRHGWKRNRSINRSVLFFLATSSVSSLAGRQPQSYTTAAAIYAGQGRIFYFFGDWGLLEAQTPSRWWWSRFSCAGKVHFFLGSLAPTFTVRIIVEMWLPSRYPLCLRCWLPVSSQPASSLCGWWDYYLLWVCACRPASYKDPSALQHRCATPSLWILGMFTIIILILILMSVTIQLKLMIIQFILDKTLHFYQLKHYSCDRAIFPSQNIYVCPSPKFQSCMPMFSYTSRMLTVWKFSSTAMVT